MGEDVDTDTLTEGLPADQDTVSPDDGAGDGGGILGKVRQRKRRSDAGQPRGPRSTSGPRRSASKARVTSLAGRLASGVSLAAAGLATVDPYSAAVVGGNAEKLANAWAPVIANNPRIVAAINHLEKGGNIGAALLATGAVALPILVHHRPQWFPDHIRAVGRAMGPQVADPTMNGHGPVG